MTNERAVHKHVLPDVLNTISLYRGASVLHVAEQRGAICIWEAHPVGETARERRRFRVVGTGQAFPGGGHHVGTFLTEGGTFVFHVFEEEVSAG